MTKLNIEEIDGYVKDLGAILDKVENTKNKRTAKDVFRITKTAIRFCTVFPCPEHYGDFDGFEKEYLDTMMLIAETLITKIFEKLK